MANVGIRSRRFQKAFPTQQTTIDGLPVVLRFGSIRFVDGGATTNGAGLTTGTAHNSIANAVAAATRDDTVFIRPLAVGNFYTEAVIVPVSTHANLSFIGLGNGKGNSVYQACTLRTSTNVVDSPVLELRSSFANLENLHFWSRAGQTHGFGVIGRWNTGSGLNIGSSIVNCSFAADVDDHPAAGGVVQSAVRIDSSEGWLIENCFFNECRIGISLGSTASATYANTIRGNKFGGLAANIAADIMIADSYRLDIVDNHFAHAKPSNGAGGMNEYVFVIGGTTTTGYFGGNHQGASDVASATNNNLGSLVLGGNFGSGGPWTS